MDLLLQTVNMIPKAFPFSSEIKNITQALANEPHGITSTLSSFLTFLNQCCCDEKSDLTD